MTTKHTIDWYVGLMDELDDEFADTVTMFDEIDKMIRVDWSLPGEFTAVVKDVMAIIDTAPSDAINSGAIAMSRNVPIFSVMPFRANTAEYDRAQSLEENLRYQFKRSNKRGNGSVMYDIAESSLRYNTIGVRTDDLAHILPKNRKKWTTMQKVAWAYGRFIHTVVNAKGLRYLFSPMGLTTVGHTQTLRARDCVNHWELYENNDTDEGKKVAQALKDLRARINDITKVNRNGVANFTESDLFVTQTYVIDYDKLCIWASLTDRDGNDVTASDSSDSNYEFVFADQENPYGFIPWSVRVAGTRIESTTEYRVNPLLAPLYWSKSWDKINLAKSIIYSEPIRRARHPRGVSLTQSGEPVQVDHEEGSDINLRVGEDYKPFTPVTLDQGAMAIVGQMEAAMNRTTGASMIGDTTKIDSRTPFATFAGMVKVALARLDKQNEIIADSVTDMACHVLWWVDKTDVPLQAYVEADMQFKSGTKMMRGRGIEIGKGDYSLENLGLSCKVVPSTPTDRMEQLNMAVMLSEKLNMPASELLQAMGYENVGLSYELWVREFLKKAEVQAQAAELMAGAQTRGQLMAQQEAQAAMQGAVSGQPSEGGGQPAPGGPPPMGAGGGIANAAFGNMGGSQGFNPALQGAPPATGAPTMTREAITGRTAAERR